MQGGLHCRTKHFPGSTCKVDHFITPQWWTLSHSLRTHLCNTQCSVARLPSHICGDVSLRSVCWQADICLCVYSFILSPCYCLFCEDLLSYNCWLLELPCKNMCNYGMYTLFCTDGKTPFWHHCMSCYKSVVFFRLYFHCFTHLCVNIALNRNEWKQVEKWLFTCTVLHVLWFYSLFYTIEA